MLSGRNVASQLGLLSMLLLAASAMAQNAAGATRVDSPQIVGGTPAGPNDNPFQVGLLVKNVPDNVQAQFCGGTLIAPDVVVTAAHCDYRPSGGAYIPLRPEDVQVLTGTRSLQQGGQRWDVISISDHPNYKPGANDYDVAVWKLKLRAEGIPLARLAQSDGVAGSTVLVTGWGRTTDGGLPSATLLKITVPIASHAACETVYGTKLTPRMLCAGFKAGGKDSCQGDSGGPATRGANNMTLMGIVSWGYGCAQPDTYGVYTRVSDPAIRNFIREHLN
jgi:trypsin